MELLHPTPDIPETIWISFRAYGRAIGFVTLLPMLSTRATPRWTRMAIALIIAPLFYAQIQPVNHEVGLVPAVLIEGITGLVLGGFVRVIWELTTLPFSLADITAGRGSMAGAIAIQQQDDSPMKTLAGLALLATTAATASHLQALETLSVTRVHLATLCPQQFLGVFQTAFTSAIGISIPILIASLIVDLSLGWANRTLPSLPAMFIAMPIRSLAIWGMIAIIIAAISHGLGDNYGDYWAYLFATGLR